MADTVSQCACSSGLLTIQKRDKNPTLNREVLCAKMRARNEPTAGERRKKVIAREDGYTYIAALRSPDLRHTTKREGDTSVTVVTSNVSVSQCAGEMLKRKGLPNRRCREKIKIRAGSRAGRP